MATCFVLKTPHLSCCKAPTSHDERNCHARWAAEKNTWNTFAGIPCQVGSRKVLPGTVRIRIRVRIRVRVVAIID